LLVAVVAVVAQDIIQVAIRKMVDVEALVGKAE
jgi:hypothetical protein